MNKKIYEMHKKFSTEINEKKNTEKIQKRDKNIKY